MSFQEKIDMNRKIHAYKARLVTKGFTQTHGIDYEESFSHVVTKSVKIIFSIGVYYDYGI